MFKDICQRCPTVLISQWNKDNGWQRQEIRSGDFQASGLNELPRPIATDSSVCVIFASANKIRECPRCRHSFTNAFSMPQLWWSDYCRKSSGYFGSERTGTGSARGFNTWVHLETKQVYDEMQYKWHKINAFTRWLPASRQMAILIFDAQSPVSELISEPNLDLHLGCVGDPFWIHAFLLEHEVCLQDSAVWALRDRVRKIEVERKPTGKPQLDYEHLHNLTRHTIHVCETLNVTAHTIGCIMVQHAKSMTGDEDLSPDIHSRLQFFESIISSLQCRAVSIKERLLNEIHLSFNNVAQYDAGISVEIGQATRSDSAAMKTIAFVTLAFLPPTFICAIFSMSFFKYSDSGDWAISNKFWVYWAFAIPITLTTFALWYFWYRHFLLLKPDKLA